MTRKIKEILLFHEAPLWLAWLTAGIFLIFDVSHHWLINFHHPLIFGILFAWLFLLILWNAFEVSHHVEQLAEFVRQPFSTLILTLSVISIEIVTISSVMFHGENNPTLARNTMYSIIMIVLNGVVGLSLFLGGIRYGEQRYNLRGSIEFMSVIFVLGVIGLVLPNFTRSSIGPTFTILQTFFFIITSLGIYSIFLCIQTISHRAHFVSKAEAHYPNKPMNIHIKYSPKSAIYHGFLLITYLIPTLLLAKQISYPIDTTLDYLHPPQTLGGFLVAVLVLSPEGVSAIRASLANHLQRSVNIALGSVLATTALTIPAVLIIGLITNRIIILGLPPTDVIILIISLITGIVTFASGRSGMLQGAIHLLLFFAYVIMIFD